MKRSFTRAFLLCLSVVALCFLCDRFLSDYNRKVLRAGMQSAFFAGLALVNLFPLKQKLRAALAPAALLPAALLSLLLVPGLLAAGLTGYTACVLMVLAFPCFSLCAAGLQALFDRRDLFLARADGPSPAYVFFAVFVTALVAGGVQWIDYFPYINSPDTSNQLMQITGEIPYSTVHAIGHTLLLKAFCIIGGSLAFAVFAQMLISSAFLAVFSAYLYKEKRVRPETLIALITLISYTIVYHETLFTPLKDLPAALCLGALTIALMRVMERKIPSYWMCAFIGAALALCYLFRLNGVVTLLAVGAYLAYWLIRRKRVIRFFVIALTAAALIAGVNLYADRALGVERRPNGYAVQVFGSGISAVVASGGEISADQYARIERILPVSWMKVQYAPWTDRSLLWKGEAAINDVPETEVYNNAYVVALGENQAEVVKLYFELLPRNFWLLARDVLYNTCYAYALWNPGAFENNILILLLIAFAARRLRKSGRPAGRVWVCALPVLLNAVSIMISTTTNENRYYLPTVLIGGFLFLYAQSARFEGDDCVCPPDTNALADGD